jgi:hypothetical protein
MQIIQEFNKMMDSEQSQLQLFCINSNLDDEFTKFRF